MTEKTKSKKLTPEKTCNQCIWYRSIRWETEKDFLNMNNMGVCILNKTVIDTSTYHACTAFDEGC